MHVLRSRFTPNSSAPHVLHSFHFVDVSAGTNLDSTVDDGGCDAERVVLEQVRVKETVAALLQVPPRRIEELVYRAQRRDNQTGK